MPGWHPLIQRVFDIALARGITVFLVGGTVRDLLLGAETHDLDFAVQGDALVLARRIADELGGAYLTLDRERRTGRVLLSCTRPEKSSTPPASLHLDLASLRGQDLIADLRDRDFTVNAIALVQAADGAWQLVDPAGGIEDMHKQVLRAVSASSFANDPVRTLRAVRMHIQFGFAIEPQTLQWLRRAGPLLRHISAERVRDEWFKILMLPGTATALRVLHEVELLQHIAPPVAELAGVQQSDPHPVDVLAHSLEVVDATERIWAALQKREADLCALVPEAFHSLAPDILRRYESRICDERTYLGLLKCAALLHDVGKSQAEPGVQDGQTRSVGHEQAGAEIADTLGRQWRCSNAERTLLRTVVGAHPLVRRLGTQPTLTRRAIHRYFRNTGCYGIDAAIVSLADYWATYRPLALDEDWQRHTKAVRKLLEAYFRQRESVISPPPLLSGQDIVDLFQLAPGPLVGRVLDQLREAQAAGEIQIRKEAIVRVQEWLDQEERS